jgi:tRNA modification GTPase
MVLTGITDTIAAISTPVGEGGIGIVRLSGKDALGIADKIFISSSGKKPSNFKTHTLHYGTVVEGGRVVDEAILTLMLAPRSYTREDIVEINCHGGIAVLQDVLQLTLKHGARLASPGEFTKRAFLNGRIDLVQAEAVIDIVRAKTDSALKMSTAQLRGGLSKEVNKIRGILLEILATIEAGIDFPGEDLKGVKRSKIKDKVKGALVSLRNLVTGFSKGRVIREGVKIAICGKPNVGKSSLLNILLKQERALVTSYSGTTRDIIEDIIDIKGIPVKIADTAGILRPKGLIEHKAVKRTYSYIDTADIAILLFDGSKALNKDDLRLMYKLKKRRVIAVINKIDIKQKINRERIKKSFSRVLEISAKKAENINLLEEEIADLVFKGRVGQQEHVLVANFRHAELLKKAQKNIEEVLISLDNKTPEEFLAYDIKEAVSYLEDILGKGISEGALGEIFKRFCIGK